MVAAARPTPEPICDPKKIPAVAPIIEPTSRPVGSLEHPARVTPMAATIANFRKEISLTSKSNRLNVIWYHETTGRASTL